MSDGLMFLVMDWHMLMLVEVQINRRIDGNLMILIVDFQMLEVGILGHGGSLVVEETRNAVWFLHFVLGLDDQITILDANVQFGRIDRLGDVKFHRHSFATIFGVHNAREQVLVHVFVRLFERHFDDQMTVRGHERDQLFRLGVRRQQVGFLELLHGKVIAFVFDLFAADYGQFVTLDLRFDRLGRVTDAVYDDSVLLWHLWHNRQLWQKVRFVQPFQITADHMIELIERIEQIERRWSQMWRLEPLVHIHGRSWEKVVRNQRHFFFLALSLI